MKKNRTLNSLFFGWLLLLIACQTQTKQDLSEKSQYLILSRKVFDDSGMDTTQLTDTVFLSVLRCAGRVDVFPNGRQLISSPIGGLISKFDVLEGDRVSQGSLLFSISNPELSTMQYELLEAAAQLELLTEQVQRARNLAEGDVTSRRELLEKETAFRTAKARHEALQKKMEVLQLDPVRNGIVSKINYYAPFTGIVAKRMAVNGQYVPVDQALVELIDDNKKNVCIEVAGNQRSLIQENQQVLLLRPDGSPTAAQGIVRRISPLAEATTSAVTLTAAFAPADLDLMQIGSFVNVGIVTSSRKVTCLPAIAIIPREGKQYVLVVERSDENNLYLLPVEVTTGETNGGYTELLNVLDIAGKQIISVGGFQLLQ